MTRIVKDKNLIKIYTDESETFYSLNINEGVMLGKKGNPIKTFANASKLLALLRGSNRSNLYEALDTLIRYEGTQTYKYAKHSDALQGADKIDALGIVNLCINNDEYAVINKDFPLFVKYYKEACNSNTELSREWVRNFPQYARWQKALKELGQYAEHISARMYDVMTNYGRRNYATEEWGVIAYYLVRGKMWDYTNGDVRKLVDYLAKCQYIKKQPQKVNNFMREWCETEKEYLLRKEFYDAERMAKNYAQHSKAFEFTYGDYTVVIPSSPSDIINEGRNMHHCVGNYVQRVVDNTDYIVFVRHKDTPENCYITCEVYTDGRIGQYYLAYDRYISSETDRAFYRAFAEHLARNW